MGVFVTRQGLHIARIARTVLKDLDMADASDEEMSQEREEGEEEKKGDRALHGPPSTGHPRQGFARGV